MRFGGSTRRRQGPLERPAIGGGLAGGGGVLRRRPVRWSVAVAVWPARCPAVHDHVIWKRRNGSSVHDQVRPERREGDLATFSPLMIFSRGSPPTFPGHMILAPGAIRERGPAGKIGWPEDVEDDLYFMIQSPENVGKACPATLSGDRIIVLRSTPTLSGHSIKHASSPSPAVSRSHSPEPASDTGPPLLTRGGLRRRRYWCNRSRDPLRATTL